MMKSVQIYSFLLILLGLIISNISFALKPHHEYNVHLPNRERTLSANIAKNTTTRNLPRGGSSDHHHHHHNQQQPTAFSSSSSIQQQQRQQQQQIVQQHQQRKRQLDAIKFVSTINILINTFRPDENITWQMRLPRICWEACIRIVAQSAYDEPSNMILLSLMLGTTAMIDIFLWGPLFGAFTSFETCSGGGWFSRTPRICEMDYSGGISRLLATFQSIFGGLFYLANAVALWNSFWAIRLEYKVERQMSAMAEALDNHNQQQRKIE